MNDFHSVAKFQYNFQDDFISSHIDFDSISEGVFLAWSEAVDILAGADIADETVGVADAAPRLEADKGASLLVWRPDTISLRLRTTDTKHGSAFLVA